MIFLMLIFAEVPDNSIRLFLQHWAEPVQKKKKKKKANFFYGLFSVCLFVCLHAGQYATVMAMFSIYLWALFYVSVC